MTRPSPLRALAVALALGAPAAAVLAPAVPAFAQAQRDAGAEQFVQREASRALQILRGGENRAQEKAEFRAFIDQVADVPRITDFVLGKYRRSLNSGDYQRFAAAFRDYANSVYENRLGQYHGESLRVTGSAVRRPGDVVVDTEVVGGRQSRPAPVAWRVINAGGGWKVVDVNVAGVWLAITERQDFVSTLDNNRGDINVLIDQLRRQTAGGGGR